MDADLANNIPLFIYSFIFLFLALGAGAILDRKVKDDE